MGTVPFFSSQVLTVLEGRWRIAATLVPDQSSRFFKYSSPFTTAWPAMRRSNLGDILSITEDGSLIDLDVLIFGDVLVGILFLLPSYQYNPFGLEWTSLQ
jgi:hypothetical protein